MDKRNNFVAWLSAIITALVIVVISVEGQPTTSLQFGSVTTLLDTTSAGAVTGTTYALPTTAAQVISYQSVLSGGPSALATSFQASMDGTNWQTVVSFSTATGQVYTTGVTSYRYIRATQTSRTGGTNTQLLVSVQRAFQTTGNAVNITNTTLGISGGTQSVPGIYHATNPDTGMWIGAPDTVTFTSDGANRFSISTANGNTSSARLGPDQDVTRDLGSTTLRWRDFYLGSNILFGTGSAASSIRSNGTALEFKLADNSGYSTTVANNHIALNYFQNGATANSADAGNVRLPNNFVINARNSGGTANGTVLDQTGGSTISLGTASWPTKIRTSLAVTPAGLTDGDWWVQCTGTSPSRVCAIQVRDGGATRTIASMTY